MQVSPFPTADPPSARTTSSSSSNRSNSTAEKKNLPNLWETKIQNQKNSNNSDDVVITARKKHLDGKMAKNLHVKSGSERAKRERDGTKKLSRDKRGRRERERERARARGRGRMGTSGVHCGS
jgi:hypothetical protein